MDPVGLLFLTLGMASFIGLVTGVYQTLSTRPSPMAMRLESVTKRVTPRERVFAREEAEGRRPRRRPRRRRRKEDLLPTVTRLITSGPLRFLKGIQGDLIRIGAPLRASEVAYGAVVLGFLLMLIAYLLLRSEILALAAGGFGLYLPFAIVRFVARRWMSRFEQHLADTLILMANAMRSGYGVMQAIEMVAQEGMPPISTEFQQALREIQLGATLDEAFNNMCDRVQNRDLDIAVTTILITRQVGGSLADILTTLSETIRERIRIRRELAVLTAQGRITGMGLSLLPLVMIFLLNTVTRMAGAEEPYTAVLFQDPLGKKLVLYGVVSQVIGYIIIQRIVNIEF